MKKVIGFAAIGLLLAGCSGSGEVGSSTSGSSGGTGTSSSTTGSPSCGAGSSVSSPDVDTGCGTVSVQGSCAGNTLTFCYQGDLADGGTGPVSIDCGSVVSGDPNITCGFVDSVYGYDCVSALNSECVFQDQNGDPLVQFCAGACGVGCNLNTGNCANGVASCKPLADGGAPPAQCVGNNLQLTCQDYQPIFFDCAALGGSCSNAQCVNLPAGSECDDDGSSTSPTFICAAGHNCVAAPDGGSSFCQ